MSGLFRRVAAFLRWLFASEELPAIGDPNRRLTRPKSSFAGWVLGAEQLDTDRSGRTIERPSGSLFRLLFTGEELPEYPAGASNTRGFWQWLMSAEELPHTKGSAPASRTAFLRRLVAPEVLPELRVPDASRRAGFVSWLLAPEACPTRGSTAARSGGGFMGWVLSGENCPEQETPARRAGGDSSAGRSSTRTSSPE